MRGPAVIVLLAATAVTAVAAVPAADGAPRTTTVKMGEYFYSPKKVVIRRGERVRFVNVGRIEHTVADTDAKGTIRSKVIRPRLLERGQSQTVTFRKAGTVRYLCTLHPGQMSGRVVVR